MIDRMQVETMKVLVELGGGLEVFTLFSLCHPKLMNFKARQHMILWFVELCFVAD
jgi:hypothetical protein